MPKEGIPSDIKLCVKCFGGDVDCLYDKPKGQYLAQKLSDNCIEVLKDMLALLFKTEFLQEQVKIYFRDPYLTQVGAFEKLQDTQIERAKTEKAYNAVIYKASNKIKSLIGGERLSVIFGMDDDQLHALKNKIREARIRNNSQERLRRGCILRLPTNILNIELEEKDFEEMVIAIKPYVLTQIRIVEESLSEEQIGYFNYLLRGEGLNEVDIKRLEDLSMYLGG